MTDPIRTTDGFLRLREVLTLFPVSKSAWYAGIAAGRYPAGIKLSERVSAWRRSDIVALMARVESEARKSSAA